MVRKVNSEESCKRFIQTYSRCHLTSHKCHHKDGRDSMTGLVLFPKSTSHAVICAEVCMAELKPYLSSGKTSLHAACLEWYKGIYPDKDYIDYSGYSVKSDGSLEFKSRSFNSPQNKYWAFECEQTMIKAAHQGKVYSIARMNDTKEVLIQDKVYPLESEHARREWPNKPDLMESIQKNPTKVESFSCKMPETAKSTATEVYAIAQKVLSLFKLSFPSLRFLDKSKDDDTADKE